MVSSDLLAKYSTKSKVISIGLVKHSPQQWTKVDHGAATSQMKENLFRISCSESYEFCVKTVPTRSYSHPYFPAFGLNIDRYSVFSSNDGKYIPE